MCLMPCPLMFRAWGHRFSTEDACWEDAFIREDWCHSILNTIKLIFPTHNILFSHTLPPRIVSHEYAHIPAEPPCIFLQMQCLYSLISMWIKSIWSLVNFHAKHVLVLSLLIFNWERRRLVRWLWFSWCPHQWGRELQQVVPSHLMPLSAAERGAEFIYHSYLGTSRNLLTLSSALCCILLLSPQDAWNMRAE